MNGKADREKRGVALIISVGILALVAMIATSFAVNMQIEYKAALNFNKYAEASTAADAGMDVAIADIRYWAQNAGYPTLMANISSNYGTSASEVAIPGTNDTYKVTVQREEALADGTDQLIDVNTIDETDYPWIDRLKNAGLTYDQIARIIDYRDPDSNNTVTLLTGSAIGPHTTAWIQACNGGETNAKNAPYATIEEVRIALNDDTAYDSIKDIITVTCPVIRGGLIGKYYSERSGWNANTILNLANFRGKVIELGPRDQAWNPDYTFPGVDGDFSGWPEAHDAEWQGGYIAEDFSVGNGLDQFGAVFSGYLYISQSMVGQNIQFWVTHRDGARFFIDGTQLTSSWATVTSSQEDTANMTFTRAGWHPIRVEYFNEGNENALMLQWNALPYPWAPTGGNQRYYILREYLGYCPTSFYGKIFDYSDQKFIMEEGLQPTTTGIQYNHAGVFRITSTGTVKSNSGSILATRQVSSIVKVFGTWTQTTRAEFSRPWFSDYYNPKLTGYSDPGGNGFNDGEFRNVTWMDSCPTDQDSYDPATHKMHWEGSYATVPDSLKLGYWNNFDEDVAYNVIFIKGGGQEHSYHFRCSGRDHAAGQHFFQLQ